MTARGRAYSAPKKVPNDQRSELMKEEASMRMLSVTAAALPLSRLLLREVVRGLKMDTSFVGVESVSDIHTRGAIMSTSAIGRVEPACVTTVGHRVVVRGVLWNVHPCSEAMRPEAHS